jgi:hypothetical protein
MSAQFNALHDAIKSKRNLTVTHKTRLERIVALHRHVYALECERDAAENYYPNYKRDALTRRLEGFKPSSFFLTALEALAAEVRSLN